ncbi:MAG: amidohydrolase family protein [Chloroflexota bacterium]
MPGSVLFRNVGTLVSGDLAQPLLEASSVFVEDGVIKEIGAERLADTIVDVRGATLAPAYWDSHSHPYFGEYSPRVEARNVISRTVRGGTATLISAGPTHHPGIYLPSEQMPNIQSQARLHKPDAQRARDASGAKALAIVMAKAWQQFRPLGVKCYAGTVIAEDGMTQEDFAEMAGAGVQRVKFIRPVSSSQECQRYGQWAHDLGLLTMTHTGGRKLVQDTASIGDALRAIHPDVACHVNGGPIPPPRADVDWLIRETDCTLDVVLNGNMNVARYVMEQARDRGELHRVVIGTDTPAQFGIVSRGVQRMIVELCAMTDFRPEQLMCMASGNTARRFCLPGGLVQVGQPADLVVWDPADGSETDDLLECLSYGDQPCPGLIMVDGEITVHGNPQALDAKRMPVVKRG